MSKSILILALICLILALGGLTAIASAGCATCGDVENWNGPDTLNSIGNTAGEQTTQVYNAAAARVTESQFNGGSLNQTANNLNTTKNVAQLPELSVSLNNIGASPNPANPGSPVKITATLGDVENMTAYAVMRNSFGVHVGNVTLDQTPGGEYVGTWTAGIATGVYNADLVASSQGESKTFTNVLQIEVIGSGNATSTGTTTTTSAGSSGKTTNYLKLG